VHNERVVLRTVAGPGVRVSVMSATVLLTSPYSFALFCFVCQKLRHDIWMCPQEQPGDVNACTTGSRAARGRAYRVIEVHAERPQHGREGRRTPTAVERRRSPGCLHSREACMSFGVALQGVKYTHMIP